MNHTINFRGKSLSTGEWVYGYYYVDVQESDDMMFFEELHFIQAPYGDHYQAIEVDPKTVGQYTGFNDSNKKEIYDDDVLRCTPTVEVYRQCVWSNGEYYLVEVNVPCTISFPLGAVSTSHKNAKIIGNIHDNPDLLTQ